MQTKVVSPSYEHIARVAYRIYLERGTSSGPGREDWLQAEQLLKAYLDGDSVAPASGGTLRSSTQPA